MTTKKLSAGDIIEARCTRCRDILNHRIVAMVGDKIVKVECNTCGGTHNYHPPAAPKTARTTTSGAVKKPASPRAAKPDSAAAEREEWTQLMAEKDVAKAVAYDMNRKFSKGEVVRHPSFGLGIVKQVIVPNKILVLFEVGSKLLRSL